MSLPALYRSGSVTWNRFWFSPAQAHSLCLLRIFFGVVLLARLCLQNSIWNFPWMMMFPKQLTLIQGQIIFKSAFLSEHLLDRWYLPYPWLTWMPMPTAIWHDRLVQILLILTVLLILGLWARWVVPAAALLFSYLFFLSQWNYYHHMLVFAIVLWIMAFGPCAKHYSLDALLRKPNPLPDKPTTILPIRLIQFLICCIYFFTFISKCNPGWWTGDIMQIFHERGSMKGPWAQWLLSFTPYQAMGIGTLVVEALIPIGLIFRATRGVAILAGIVLHLTIDLTMQVNTYGYQMMALYIVFIYPASNATVVLYDKKCTLCQKSLYFAKLLDWFQRMQWVDFRDPQVAKSLPFLSPQALDQQMHVIVPCGKVLVGFAAWRQMLSSFPLTFVPAFLLYLPPMGWMGAVVYRFVADHRRKRLCPILPDLQIDEPWKKTLQNAQQHHLNP